MSPLIPLGPFPWEHPEQCTLHKPSQDRTYFDKVLVTNNKTRMRQTHKGREGRRQHHREKGSSSGLPFNGKKWK
jgi:hypothetical protein